ncbi:LysR family transcriptional regulator [Conexibacter sp. JD483]|uniref:LysR family transcriptional regulator n=1 Tax=unclassified Conexibacter TaxID=2627773 RepID=UPI0027196F0B|nr:MULTISPECIES: LysR family transcriptional regulator [unclassified Conexibacter]MDO8188552.1 LysR family transcriptional regulator [Conexibacter sp. CPCC 205706]MDO8199935.1 LysR family transcriptional regulator [Conexibacter sp. CPCC 205762]MDR9370705.1 LysR family transcriptional regulator [Conexibacter sp. JD483]
MTFEELHWFVVVAECEHVTAAATRLHVSQSALSRALARVQADVGVPLFDRDGRRLRLNRYGRLYLEHARRALAQLDAGRAELEQETGASGSGTVALAFLHTFGTWLVPALLRAFAAVHPQVTLELAQDSASAILTALRDGSADLVVTSPRPDDPSIAWHVLTSEPLRLAVPPGHRLAARRRVRLAEVAQERFVAMKPAYGIRGVTDEICAAAGFAPQIAFEGDDVATLRGLVEAGLGVGLLPPPHAGGTEQLHPATPHLQVADRGAARQLGLAWDRTRWRAPAVEAFRAFVVAEGGAIAAAGAS